MRTRTLVVATIAVIALAAGAAPRASAQTTAADALLARGRELRVVVHRPMFAPTPGTYVGFLDRLDADSIRLVDDAGQPIVVARARVRELAVRTRVRGTERAWLIGRGALQGLAIGASIGFVVGHLYPTCRDSHDDFCITTGFQRRQLRRFSAAGLGSRLFGGILTSTHAWRTIALRPDERVRLEVGPGGVAMRIAMP